MPLPREFAHKDFCEQRNYFVSRQRRSVGS